jgi:hypothetical protein
MIGLRLVPSSLVLVGKERTMFWISNEPIPSLTLQSESLLSIQKLVLVFAAFSHDLASKDDSSQPRVALGSPMFEVRDW